MTTLKNPKLKTTCVILEKEQIEKLDIIRNKILEIKKQSGQYRFSRSDLLREIISEWLEKK